MAKKGKKGKLQKTVSPKKEVEEVLNSRVPILSTVEQIEVEDTRPKGIVLTTAFNATKTKPIFTRVRTTNPDNNKELTILYYNTGNDFTLFEPGTIIAFEFGTHQGKYTCLNPTAVGHNEAVASAAKALATAPVIKGMYRSAVLEQIADSPAPKVTWDKLNPVGQNDDIVYVLNN